MNPPPPRIRIDFLIGTDIHTASHTSVPRQGDVVVIEGSEYYVDRVFHYVPEQLIQVRLVRT